MLGQPRGVSLRRELRDGLLEGGTDEVVAQRMRIDAESEICPVCGYRPQRVATTGLCLTCHLSQLADGHAEAADDHEALQRLWRERQRKKAAIDGMGTA